MENITFNQPDIDIFDPALNKSNRRVQEWDEAYNRLDIQGQLNAAEIRAELGSRPDEVVIDRPEQTGLYVDIQARAIALEGITEYLNKANEVYGGKIYTATGGTNMRRRYGEDLDQVLAGAEQNRDNLLPKFRSGIETLTATDALRAYGFDDQRTEKFRSAMENHIERELGVGRADASKRNRVARNARKLANAVAGRKTPR